MSTELIQVEGHELFQKIRSGIFNIYHIHVYGISIHAEDVKLTYSVRIDKKVNKSDLADLKAFCKGIAYVYSTY